MDDFGFPPDEIRQNILSEEGEWNLTINELALKNKAKLLKILRQALGLSILEAAKLLKNFPDIISGTRTEMKWLKKLLSNEEIQSIVKRNDLA
jgi:ribosomal protein L7/L12